jgi:hypothetical protein
MRPSMAERLVLWLEHQMDRAEARLIAAEAKVRAQAWAVRDEEAGSALAASGVPVGGNISGTEYVVTALSACYGASPIEGADVFLYVPTAYDSNTGIYTYTLQALNTTDALGTARVFVPPLTVGGNAYIRIVGFRYAVYQTFLSAGGGSVVARLSPATSYQASPPVYIYGAGFGASLLGAPVSGFFIATARGSGYDGSTVLQFGVTNDSGYAAIPQVGYYATGGTVTSAGSGYTSAPTVTLTESRTVAQLSCVASSKGLINWVVTAAGNGYTLPPTITAPGPPFAGRAARLRAIISGGQVTGYVLDDPGFGYTNGTTYTATVSGGYGSGGGVGLRVQGGAVVGVTPAANGGGYWTIPSATLSGGAGTGAAISIDWVKGVIAGQQTRGADVFGCFGNGSRPVRLTGYLSSAYGTIDLGWSPLQVAQGDVADRSTMPETVYSGGYFEIRYAFVKTGTIRYYTTWSGGTLVGVTITEAGYGYTGDVIIQPDPARYPSGTTTDQRFGGFPGIIGNASHTGTQAQFRITVDGSGSASGWAIDNAGSGYCATGGTPFTGGSSSFLAIDSPRGEYELQAWTPTLTVGGTVYPDPQTPQAIVTTNLLAQVRASSYGFSPRFSATYDFDGTALGNLVFPSGSRSVSYDEGTP